LLVILLLASSSVLADRFQYHDGHIHYDRDIQDSLSPAEAIELLQEEGIERVLVSATPAQAAAMLYRQNSEIVVPMS